MCVKKQALLSGEVVRLCCLKTVRAVVAAGIKAGLDGCVGSDVAQKRRAEQRAEFELLHRLSERRHITFILK